MSETNGSEFCFWGGDIWGKNIKVEKEKLLVQEWWSEKKWMEPSIVTFTLSKMKNGIKLELLQENVPESEFADLDEGWDKYFLAPIKEYLESK